MRLLICTQAVDLDDPVLGFFHGWLVEFSKQFETIHVVCLKEGRHDLPTNVTVHSLGKETGPSRVKYISRLYRYIWSLHKEYDAVFVHMNQEYVLLGGKLWWLMGKRVVLWRNHKKGSMLTRIACMFAHVVCYTSPEAYVARYKNAVEMPIGIDTERFALPTQLPRPDTILFLGRLDAVKNPGIFLEAMSILDRSGIAAHADIYGDPTPGREEYAHTLKERFKDLQNVIFHPGVRNDETPALYGAHAIYVNLTPSGSFDKTIGEAMATGCAIVTANSVVKEVVAPACMVTDGSAEATVGALKFAAAFSEEERRQVAARHRAYIEDKHSLASLSRKLSNIFNGKL